MKKLAILIVIVLCLTACGFEQNAEDRYSFETLGKSEVKQPKEVAVWISYIELKSILTGNDEQVYRDNLKGIFENLSTLSADTVYLQVRPFADSIYPSDIYPKSSLVSSDTGAAFVFDPLKIFIDVAKESGVGVYAWINPFRLSSGSYGNSDFIAKLAEKDMVLNCESGKMLDPSSADTAKLIADGAGEVCNKYDVLGVIFDDYFYPADFTVDKSSYDKYCESGGSLSQADWRCSNVNNVLAATHTAVAGAGKQFGISPAASIGRNKDSYGLDIAGICSKDGYIDFISPQIYFGFNNQAMPFSDVLAQWAKAVGEMKCIISVAAYKTGTVDKFAGSGSGEWQTSFDILARQYEAIESNNVCSGIALYRYGSLFTPDESVSSFAVIERENLKNSILG